MNKNLLLRGSVGKEAASCFYLDFGDAGGSVTISSNTLKSFNYSLDKQQWNVVSPGGTITVNSGKVYLCAATPVTSLFSQDVSSNKWTISGSNVKAGGNINTLLNADDPDGVVYSPYTFAYLFYGCISLTEAPALPATTLANNCYDSMFFGCISLTEAPALPSTTLANFCYRYMFGGCTSLTQAPALPATTLADFCYTGMFDSCTGLTQAPALPATTLADFCYQYMFYGCTSLTQAPPVLPATTLANFCYDHMFYQCSKLAYIKCLATDIYAWKCTYNWVYGVAKSGTFVKAPSMTSWETGTRGIPSGWTVQNA